MALPLIQVFQYDLLPILEFELRDHVGNPLNLTSVLYVRFYMGVPGSLIINGSDLTITDPLKGKCEYAWKLPETDVVGEYTGEVVVTFADGRPQTAGQITVEIVESLR